jgi:hypothetical protein
LVYCQISNDDTASKVRLHRRLFCVNDVIELLASILMIYCRATINEGMSLLPAAVLHICIVTTHHRSSLLPSGHLCYPVSMASAVTSR